MEWNGVRQEVSFKEKPSERQLKLAFGRFVAQFRAGDITVETDEEWQEVSRDYRGMIQQDMFEENIYHVHEHQIRIHDNRSQVRL